jgi:signal transduction histidine kinase
MTGRRFGSNVACVRARLLTAFDYRPNLVVVDRALASLLAVDAVLEALVGSDSGHRVALLLGGTAIALPIAVRRRYPTLVGAGVPVLGAFVHALWDGQAIAYPLAEFCALYALAAWTPTRRFLYGSAAFVAATLVPVHGGDLKGGLGFASVALVAMLLVRRILGDRERRATLAERERDVATREAVVEERARIARELHDAIAHHVSLMVVQAGAERRILDGRDGSTHEVLQTIEQTGRGALTEMRRLVGMLRNSDGDPLAPQPSLAELPRLAAQVSEAGLPVELEIEGERRELPLGIELSAYRIVQEALTNALKHAGDARALVRVRYAPDQLELEVVDNGRDPVAPVAGGGHGLVGMRERVALYGGRFDAGRRGDQGFTVRVVLPIR